MQIYKEIIHRYCIFFYEKPTKMDFDRVRSEYSIFTIMAKLGCD